MAELFASMLPPSYYPETNSTSDSSSRNGNQSMPDVELISSLMPYLYPTPGHQTQRRPPSTHSNIESSTLSDDEKRERIRLQELMLEWGDPIELSDPEPPTNEPPRERFTDSDPDEDWLLPMVQM